MTERADQATEEAAAWLIALEEEPGNTALLARFQSWLHAAPDNRRAWTDMAEVYDLMGRLPPVHADLWQDAHRPAPPSPVGISWRRPARRVAWMAMGFVLLVLVGFAIPRAELYLRADYTTGVAEVRAVTLPDGSIARLGPRAALEQVTQGDDRHFRLLKGQAFFEVTRDPAHPFRVEGKYGLVTVLGTAFELRTGAAQDRVAVRQGKVAFAPQGAGQDAGRPLAPGDWASLDATGNRASGRNAPEDVAAWLDGRIVVRDRPLAEVVQALGDYYPGLILIRDEALGTKRVTGSYNTADPVSALRALVGAHGGTVQSLSPWLLVLS